MPLPLLNLAYLVVRQVSKPLASTIKKTAKSNPVLRDRVLVAPAQLYHRLDVRLKRVASGLGMPIAVKPLTQEEAIDVAADMLGELVIYTIGAGCLLLEYLRQRRNERAKQTVQNERLTDLESRVAKLRESFEQGRAVLVSLTSDSITQTVSRGSDASSSGLKKVEQIQETANNSMKLLRL